jgi:hypothetical protein
MIWVFWPSSLKIEPNSTLWGWKDFGYIVVVSCKAGESLTRIGVVSDYPADILTVRMDPSMTYPIQITDKSTAFRIIYFDPPNQSKLQFYSQVPTILDITAHCKESNPDSITLQKLKAYYAKQPRNASVPLNRVLELVNRVSASGRKQTLYIPNSVTLKIAILWLLFLPRIIFEFILFVINFQSKRLKKLKELSQTVKHIDLRLQQACSWPIQYLEWQRSKSKLSSKAQAQYIGFWNTAWLIANDVILGIAVGSWLLEDKNNALVTQITRDFVVIMYNESIDNMMKWLVNWPAGLKLNSELSNFLGDLFRWILNAWKHILLVNVALIPIFLTFLGNLGFFGVTTMLAIFSDFISIATAHLTLLYAVSARLYSWQINVIYSTFNLFQGRKYNPLRNRIDSAEYDIDETLLGTIIFTVLVFLLPTVAAYYLLFSFVRLINLESDSLCNISRLY